MPSGTPQGSSQETLRLKHRISAVESQAESPDALGALTTLKVESVAIGRLSIKLTKRNLDTHKHLACPLCDSRVQRELLPICAIRRLFGRYASALATAFVQRHPSCNLFRRLAALERRWTQDRQVCPRALCSDCRRADGFRGHRALSVYSQRLTKQVTNRLPMRRGSRGTARRSCERLLNSETLERLAAGNCLPQPARL
jgi:hypothetical protein